jgi:hypothetical protein
MSYTYEIDDSNVVRIYADANEHGQPILLQDTKPDGTAFKSKAEATKWVEAYLVAAQEAIAEAIAEAEAAKATETPVEEPAPADPAA